MSKKLKEIYAVEKTVCKEIAAAEKALNAAKKKREKILDQWPRYFRCEKCGLAFKVNELGYKEYDVLRTEMRHQFAGDYDMQQIMEHRFYACCPKCGKDFKVEAAPVLWLGSTKTYDRYEDKPDFQEPYSKCISKDIKKVSASMIKHIENNKGKDWV